MAFYNITIQSTTMAPRMTDDVKTPLQETVYKTTTQEPVEEGRAKNAKRPRDSIVLYMSAFSGKDCTICSDISIGSF